MRSRYSLEGGLRLGCAGIETSVLAILAEYLVDEPERRRGRRGFKEPAKFYIVQPALQRLAGRARPGALVVGRELAQVVP